MRQIIRAVVLLLAMARPALADGKMYWAEKIPPTIPYQRALILFRDGTETLILQSKYEIPKSGGKSSLGWVVPVPAVPEIASMPARDARELFWRLGSSARPEVRRRIPPELLAVLSIAFGILSLTTLVLCLLSFVLRFPTISQAKGRRAKLLVCAVFGFLLSFLLLFMTSATKGIGDGIDVINEQRAGIYDVRVVKASDSKDLIGWLNADKFKFGDNDKAVIDSYLAKGWCFVVAHINPSAEKEERDISAEGLVAPLVLRFPHPAPIYPLTLTGTGNRNTEILIYLAADTKMTCGDRLKPRFAGEMKGMELLQLDRIEPEGFIQSDDVFLPYLCKFRNTLTPAQMTEDLTFTPAPDNQPFREHLTKW